MVVTAQMLPATTVHQESWPATKAQFEGLVDRHEPTVFRGLCSSWLPETNPSDLETLEWLQHLVGHRVVPVSVGLPGDAGLVGTAKVHRGKSVRTTLSGDRPFSTIAEDMRRELAARTGHLLYVQSIEVDKSMPELRPYLQLPLEHCQRPGHWRTWIGTGDHRVNLHYDADENFFCMLAGRKRFHIAPFEILKNIYIGPLSGAFGTPASLVDPLQPDLQKYPRFAEAHEAFTVVDLEPGDVLYLPAHWWHYVESFGFNMAANYWWADIPEHLKTATTIAFFEGLLELRSLPKHWRMFLAQMFTHFVFQTDGDPYAHVPMPDQGWAGVATPERADELRRMLNSVKEQAFAHATKAGPLPDGRYKVSPSLRLRFEATESIILRDVDAGRESSAGVQIVAILSQFVTPKRPSDVLDALRQGGLGAHEDQVRDAIRELIATRMIVACD